MDVAEVMPYRQRAEGPAFGSFTHWFFAASLTSLFPKVVTAFPPGYVFLFFAFMMVLQLVWVKTMHPVRPGDQLAATALVRGRVPEHGGERPVWVGQRGGRRPREALPAGSARARIVRGPSGNQPSRFDLRRGARSISA